MKLQRRKLSDIGMYREFTYQSKTLEEWQKELRFQFSLGELYQMAKKKEDFSRFLPM